MCVHMINVKTLISPFNVLWRRIVEMTLSLRVQNVFTPSLLISGTRTDMPGLLCEADLEQRTACGCRAFCDTAAINH